MFVRARARRYVDHRAALRDCLPILAVFAVSGGAMLSVIVSLASSPGMFLEDVSTRLPGLAAAAVIALLAQGAAIVVRYRDHLARQRREAEAAARACCDCRGECDVDFVFDLPRARHRAVS